MYRFSCEFKLANNFNLTFFFFTLISQFQYLLDVHIFLMCNKKSNIFLLDFFSAIELPLSFTVLDLFSCRKNSHHIPNNLCKYTKCVTYKTCV